MPLTSPAASAAPGTLVAMPEHVIAPDSLSLLSLVPELVGFAPRASLVIITFHDGASGGTLRVDLPTGHEAEGDLVRRFAMTVIGMVCRVRDADAVLGVVYSDDPASEAPPSASLAAELRRAASVAGFGLLDLLFVSKDGWGDYERGLRGSTAELDAALGLRASDPSAPGTGLSPREAAALPAVTPDELELTATALTAMRGDGEAIEPVWFAQQTMHWRPDAVGPVAAALMAYTLAVPWARDVVLFTWAWGVEQGRRALRFQRGHSRGQPVTDEQIAFALAGRGPMPRPSARDVERTIRLLREVAARVSGADRAPLVASLAWLHWALGHGSIAAEYIDQSRAADPHYPFAELIEALLNSGMVPDWVFLDHAEAAEAAAAARTGRRRGKT